MIRYFLATFEALALSVIFFGCAPSHTPPAGHDCVAACENLASLGCSEGGPTPNGAPCSTWLCETRMPESRTTCISRASSCSAAGQCK